MANSLGNLMNYGLSNNYWNEFIFQSYVNHKPDVTCMQVSRLGQFCIVYRTYTIRQWQLSLKLTNFVTEPFKVHSNTLKIAVIQTVIKNEVKAVDNQLIDEALSLYNDLRLHAYKLKFRSSFSPMWEPYTINLQSLKPKRFGVKLQDLCKQARYVGINGFHH